MFLWLYYIFIPLQANAADAVMQFAIQSLGYSEKVNNLKIIGFLWNIKTSLIFLSLGHNSAWLEHRWIYKVIKIRGVHGYTYEGGELKNKWKGVFEEAQVK